MSARGSGWLETLIVIATFGVLAFFDQRADVDGWRLAAAAIIAGIMALIIGRHRASLWWPPVLVALGSAGMTVLAMTSPRIEASVLLSFLAQASGVAMAGMLAWLLVRVLLPRTHARHQAGPVLLLGGVVSAALLACCTGLWLAAVDLHALPRVEVTTRGSDIEAAWRRPWGTRHNGVLAAGRLGNADERDAREAHQRAYLAYVGGRGSGNHPTHLPSSYALRMDDGAVVSVQGVASVTQAIDWPACGPYHRQHCLREGDPVVVWAEPGELRAIGGAATRSAMTATRVIVFGGLEEFRNGYMDRAVATARVVGWSALALVPFSLLPCWLAWRRARWLRWHGRDERTARSITWT